MKCSASADAQRRGSGSSSGHICYVCMQYICYMRSSHSTGGSSPGDVTRVKYGTGLGSSTHNATAPSRRLTAEKAARSARAGRNNKKCCNCNCGHEASGVIQKEKEQHHIVPIWTWPARDWDGVLTKLHLIKYNDGFSFGTNLFIIIIIRLN